MSLVDTTGLEREIGELRAKVALLMKLRSPKWFTLRAACEFAGFTYNSVKSAKHLQPNGGQEDGWWNHRRVWKWSTVVRWARDSVRAER